MSEYLKYNSIDFAQDDDFIAWVKGESSQNPFWEQFLKDHPDKTADIEAARQLVNAITIQKKQVSKQKLDAIWQQIDKKTPISKVEPSIAVEKTLPRRNFLKPLIGIAASLLLLFGMFQWFSSTSSDFMLSNTVGEIKEHVLPDGSTVNLNAMSTIHYNQKEFLNDRILQLEGEAFFEVRKGSSFKVITPQGSVQVLGTSFNVNTRYGLKVDCFTGKVSVNYKAQQEVILTKGKGVHFDSATVNQYDFTGESSIQWKKGIFEFVETPMSNVFEELERQYGVTIRASDAIKHKIYNGFFTKNDLDSAIHSICWPMNLKATTEGKLITIEPK